MKHNSNSPGTIPRYLVASLFLSLLPVTGQTITNGNFDAQTFNAFPGYASVNGGAITGWTATPSSRVGLNSVSGPFAGGDGGTIPSAANVAFLQAGTAGPASLSQTVTGLTIGTKYSVTVRMSARGGTAPNLVFSTDGNGPTVKLEVTPAGNAAAFKTAAFRFTATATSHLITFTNDRTSGDHTLLLDDVNVAPTAGDWSFAPWTGDADSGVDSQYVYTHAHHLYSGGNWKSININGVDFNIGDADSPNRFQLRDLTASFTNRTPNNVTGNSATLARDFRYGGSNMGITLQNLKPSTKYVFTLYGLGFDVPDSYRAATFSSNLTSEKLSVNLNHYGQGNGILVNYTYTTDALGTPVAISYPSHGSGSFHSSGFSNREFVASTPPVVWTSHLWTNDSTSGASSNHFYTHAFNFGTATGLNVNGINFTGIAGANPAGTNYTSAGFPATYNNDVNSVTNSGSILGRDFVQGGSPQVHNLTGLTPGKKYVFTIYTMGWFDGIRRASLIGGVGQGPTILNQDEFGVDQGVRFEYEYTANATGTATITASALDAQPVANFDKKTIHTYGISNREADPYVSKAPEFTLQPVGATLGVGTNYTLRAGTIGSPTMTYQWKKGTTNISGETSPTLVLSGVQITDNGAYTLVVTNSAGTVTSNVANISVFDNVPGNGNSGVGADGQILADGQIDPHFKLINNPDNTASDVVYVQTGPPGAWLPNSSTSKWIGPRANSAGSAGVLTPSGAPADAGAGAGVYVYRTSLDLTGFNLSTVAISGAWATDNQGVEIRVNGTPVGFPNTVGNTFTTLVPFTINNTAFPNLLVSGVNTIDFLVKNTDEATNGGFTGLRVDGFRAIGSIPAGTPPYIALQPANTNGRHLSLATLSVGATGSGPLSYQWYKGETPIDGAVESTLQIYIEDFSAAGNYKVKVSNSVASVDSAVATLSVPNAAPVTQFDDLGTINQNTSVDISVFELLANDTDPDGDFLEITGVGASSTQGGTVVLNDGEVTYTPRSGFVGLDSFTYTVSDGPWGGTAVGNVLVNVSGTASTPPGQLTLVISGGTVNGSFIGTPGVTYILQRSTTLAVGSWTTVTSAVAPPSGPVNVSDPSPPAGKAFYRIAYAQ